MPEQNIMSSEQTNICFVLSKCIGMFAIIHFNGKNDPSLLPVTVLCQSYVSHKLFLPVL